MKTLKKLFSVSAIVALLGTLAPMYAFWANYSDELEDAYVYAYAHKITTQGSIDAADMYGDLNRVAMAKMIANYATNVLWLEADTSRNCTFSDVPAALDAEYDNWVTNACQLGLMWIDDNGNVKATFDPKGKVTRAQFATALSRAISQAEDGEALANGNPYYRTHIAYLNGKGIVKSEAEYDVNNLEKRGYVMLMMMRADKDYTPAEGCSVEELLKCIAADDYDACMAACSGDEGEWETPTWNGYVTVKKAWTTETQKVARNAVNKKIGSIKLTAWEYDTTVNSVVVAHSGLWVSSDVTVQLYMNGVAVSSAKKITKSSQEATIKFSPSLVIKAGKSETVDIMASVSWATNETHNFSVTAVNVADWKAEGTPITLGSLETTSYEVWTVKVAFKNVASSFEAWDTDKKLATVELTPSVNSTIKWLTISKTDTTTKPSTLNFDEVFSKIDAYYNNEKVWKVTITDEKIVISDLNIERTSGKITLTLKADCMYIGKKVEWWLMVAENDVLATEATTSENMRNDEEVDSTKITIDWVDMTMKNMTTKSQKAAQGDDMVELLNVKLSTETSFELSKFSVDATLKDDSNNDLELYEMFETWSVMLYINWDEYDEITDLSQVFKDDTFDVSKNSPLTIQVFATINDTVAADSTAKFTVTINEIKNEDWDKVEVTSATVKPVTWHTTTIATGSITPKKTPNSPTNKTIKEWTDVTLLYFDLKASTEDFDIENVVVELNENLDTIKAYTDEVRLMQWKNELASFDVSAGGDTKTVKFEFDRTISKDETVSFTVEATIKDGEIANIWKEIKVTLKKINDGLANETAVTNVAGEPYKITSELPKVNLSDRNAEYTTVSFENTSSYDDIAITSFTVKVTPIIANLPKNMETFEATLKLLDGVNGNDIWTTTFDPTDPEVPWTIIIKLDTPLQDGDDAYIQLDNVQGIDSDWYTVEVTSVSFQYYDEDDTKYYPSNNTTINPAKSITENYSEKL